MTSDAIIEAAARRLHEAESPPSVSWDGAPAARRATCRAGARALAAAGLLATESPGEPLPVDQVRREPDTSNVWHRIGKADEWFCAHPDIDIRLTDDDVRDWPVLVPEAALDDLRGERDRFSARVAELDATEPQAVDADALAQALWNNVVLSGIGLDELADAIRSAFPDATVPADRVLGPTQIAIDLSSCSTGDLQEWQQLRVNLRAAGRVLELADRAELARRAAENGVSS